jgi:hypothetical protein
MLLSSILSHAKTISFDDLKIELPMMSLPCCYFVAFRILLSCCAVFKELQFLSSQCAFSVLSQASVLWNFVPRVSNFDFGGGKRDRTAGLLNAIQALSQLSYTPLVTQN